MRILRNAPHRTLLSVSIALAPALLVCAGASAYGFYDSLAGGTPFSVMGAHSAATCGARSTYDWDALAVLLNPSGLASLEGATATVSGGVMTWREVLSYSYLRQLRSGSIPGSRCLAGAIPVAGRIVAGVGAAAVSDADYHGEHLLDDPTVEEGSRYLEILDASGVQYEALGGLACDVGGGLSVGASAGMRFGEVDLDYSLYDLEMGQIDSSLLSTIETRELAVRAGAMVRGEIGAIGMTYCGAGRNYPASITGGAEAIAPHIGGTIVGFELEVGSPLARNDVTGKVNCRYPLASTTMMMVGISFGDYSASLGKGMGFSVGGSHIQGRFRLDVGVHWWSRDREGSAFEDEVADGIEDYSTELSIGLTVLP